MINYFGCFIYQHYYHLYRLLKANSSLCSLYVINLWIIFTLQQLLNLSVTPQMWGSVTSIVGVSRLVSFSSRVLSKDETSYVIQKETLDIFGGEKELPILMVNKFILCSNYKTLPASFGEQKGIRQRAAIELHRWVFLKWLQLHI